MTLAEAISTKLLILDGGMGTMIQRQGIKSVDNEQLNLTHPEAILKIHQTYIKAGADIIETNSFGANRFVQQDFCLQDQAPEMAFQAARIARKAADEASRKIWVAGSVGPTGKSLSFVSKPEDPSYRECDFHQMEEAFREQIGALIRGGVDCILLETCYDALNTKAAICSIQNLNSAIPVIISVTVSDRSGRTLTGQTIEAFYNSVRHCPNLLAFGINCALGIREMEPLVREIASFCNLPLIFYPNAGLPDRLGNWGDTPEYMAKELASMAAEGLVSIIGGCCGTTPEHIRAIAGAVYDLPANRPGRLSQTTDEVLTVSGLECVKIDRSRNFTNIGERTNVAGSKKFAKLIAESDYSSALQVAAEQIRGGADIIDINMDDPMVDSTLKMREFLRHIAGEPDIARAAIMIDSSHWETIVEGLQNAQGRCIVNSISLKEGEEEFIRKARIIHSYGAAMVVMAFDEQGQAVTYERKIDICRRSYDLLTQKANVPPQGIIFDCNILSIGTGIAEHSRFGVDFIDAIRWIKANLPGAKTSGGVSNLSFAFRGNNPIREAMHSAFLYHAIRAGLDMAIVNPSMLQIYDEIDSGIRKAVEDVIFDTDSEATSRLVGIASSYIGKSIVSGDDTSSAKMAQTASDRLTYAVVKGGSPTLANDALELVNEGMSALSIIEGPLMSGMEKVGELFSDGKMFLPQVVKSARTMQEAVAVLQPFIESGGNTSKKPKFLIATVQGDVHDIGKNIVSILLRCSGFEVIDLGVMVPCNEIIEKAITEKADIIGLSGLISPSLHYMEEICRMMNERAMDIPLIVGGAATSELHTAVRLAPVYGNVYYGSNASDTAVLAQKIISASVETSRQNLISQQRMRNLYAEGESRTRIAEVVDSRPAAPDTFGDIPLTELSVNELMPIFDWKLFRSVCNIKGASEELETAALEWLEQTSPKVILAARFFNCHRQGDDIVAGQFTLPMVHAKSSLLDFFPESIDTQFGAFAVKVDGQSDKDLVHHAALATLAEAGAEYIRKRLCLQLPESMSLITPGIGYSCLPDHTLKRDILSLLPAGLGINLSSSCAMIPETSICSLVMAGSCVKYKDPVGVTDEAMLDYAKKRGMSEEERSIWLSSRTR